MSAESASSTFTTTSRLVLDALKSVTPHAWQILRTQCELAGLAPERLLRCHLADLTPRLVAAVERYSSSENAERLGSLLRELARTHREANPEAGGPNPSASRNPFAREVLEMLAPFSPLAWPLLEAQCARVGVDVSWLGPRELLGLLDELEKSLIRFTPASDARQLVRCLRSLAQQRSGSVSFRPSLSRIPSQRASKSARPTLGGIPSQSAAATTVPSRAAPLRGPSLQPDREAEKPQRVDYNASLALEPDGKHG